MRGLRLMRAFRRCRTGRGISLCVVALAGVGVVLALPGTAVAAVSAGFIENRGQLDERILFYTHGSRISLYFSAEALIIDLREEVQAAGDPRGRGHLFSEAEMVERDPDPIPRRGCAVWVRFEDSRADPVIEARGELVTRYNYFLGDNPDEWQTDVPAYTEVVYLDVWPGVDLVYRLDAGTLEYQFLAAPGAVPGTFRYEGADHVTTNDMDGRREIRTSVGVLLDAGPVPGREKGRYEWLGESPSRERSGVAFGGVVRDNPGSLLWSTFIGGNQGDQVNAAVFGSDGSVLVTGYTRSPEFPSTPGAYDETHGGDRDGFVAKVGPEGSALLWSTFLGGTGDEQAKCLVLDSDGNPVIVGTASSPDFPTTAGAYDESHNGGSDVFIAKLSNSGSDLLWSTFLGGSDTDYGSRIALDASGNPVVTTSSTSSPDFPTTPGAYDTSLNGDDDVSVTKLDASGSALLWSTYLGGVGQDIGARLALDPSGNVVLAGMTKSPDFPTTPGAYDQTYNFAGDLSYDCFVAKLEASGSSLQWSTFFGGTETENLGGLTLDPSSNVVLSGSTSSSDDFPTTPGAYDSSLEGDCDAFLAKLDASGSSLLWSTFIGGSGWDKAAHVVLDDEGNVITVGHTDSPDFPTTPSAFDQSFNCTGMYTHDMFVSRLDGSGSELLYSTFLGGNDSDNGNAMALSLSGSVLVAGSTLSNNFPTTPGVYDTSHDGWLDCFVLELDLSDPVSVPDDGGTIPVGLVLHASSPNPFGPATMISYELPTTAHVSLRIYDVSGRVVRKLVEATRREPGRHAATWDGRDDRGQLVSCGVYFCRLEADGEIVTGRMVVLK